MPNNFTELGSSGLTQWAGIIQQDFLRELRGQEAYKRYEEMRLNSPVVGAMLMAIEQAVRSVEWQFTSENGENDPRLEILNDSRENMSNSWNDHIIEALTFLPFGFSPFEIVYKRDGSRILWRKLALRGQDTIWRWELDEAGGMEGFWQRTTTAIKGVFLPIEKLVIYRARVERNNPEGRSILRTAYTSYYFVKNFQMLEGIGVERDVAGLPVITLPEGADPTETDSETTDYGRAVRLVRNIRNDEQAGVALPPGWTLELLSAGGSKQFDVDAIINRYEKRILMSVLAQFLMLGMDRVGALSLSRDQTDLFNMSVNVIADIVSETITKIALPRLMRLNGLEADGLRLEHSPAGDIDANVVSESIQRLAPQLTWTEEDEVWLRGAFGLPKLDVEAIRAAREEKRQQEMEKEQIRNQAFQKQNGKPQGEFDVDVWAERYAVGASPDDDERREWEGKWASAAGLSRQRKD